jgi:IclR family acetate operon transcriptional repressor
VKLNPSTVHRIVRALVAQQVLEQNARTEKYYLGRATILLGQIAQRGVGLHRALHVLEELSEETGESVNLGVRDGDRAIVILRVESTQPLRFAQHPGSRVFLHASAIGKALLAYSDEAERGFPVLGPLERLTPNTITSASSLQSELVGVREKGFSIDDEEGTIGVRCVGAPVLRASGRAHAAIAVQAPAARLSLESAMALGDSVIVAAKRIAEVIATDRQI